MPKLHFNNQDIIQIIISDTIEPLVSTLMTTRAEIRFKCKLQTSGFLYVFDRLLSDSKFAENRRSKKRH